MENHVPFKHRRMTLERGEKFISKHHFADINLRSGLYPNKKAVTSLSHYAAPDRIPYTQALKGKFEPANVGQTFGPTWSTHWFRVEVKVPPEWVGQEVHLLWNSNSEAMVWVDGEPRQGLSAEKDRFEYILSLHQEQVDLKYTLYIEMACNGLFGAGENGLIGPTDPNRFFTLQQADIAVFDREVYMMMLDMEILYGMAKELPDTHRGEQALYAANDFINACDVKDRSTYNRAKSISNKFFHERNGGTQHTVHAMGHSHIDTAWLWSYDETKRKCARSWSCTIRLMERYDHFKFTCSQAQQYEWVKENYPSLYTDICKFVGQGQFIPVGGTWVEMDGYVPSGEAFVRQFLFGQRFFQKEFGVKCTEFWLPDTFGYAAQLPQIMRECGITRFVTQKMSWNLVNKFPHHTFWWQGLDGSKVLAHFPPGDNYCMAGEVKEVLYTANNFKDKGRSSQSMYLFGYGDGGNGPDEHMLQRLQRMEDIDGLPRVKMSSPREFFETVERSELDKLCTWRGELYLEMHNGTYTTHAKVKERNRKCEFLLQEVEQLWVVALAMDRARYKEGDRVGLDYPKQKIDRLWKLLLLNQFHDVLPGSSISIVYEDAHRFYTEIEKEGAELLKTAAGLVGCSQHAKSQSITMLVNTLSWPRTAVVAVPSAIPVKAQTQTDSSGTCLGYAEVPSCSVGSLEDSLKTVDEAMAVTVEEKGDAIYLKNSLLEARLDSAGRLTSLRLAGSSRELVKEGCHGNQLLLFDDVPLYWDAWDVMDYHLETRKPLEALIQKAVVKERGPLRVTVEVKTEVSAESTVVQTIQLDAGSPYVAFQTQVEWHENRKFLKVEFPTNILSMEATYEVQYGALKRPNHYNTSWDSARYEVCGQKWADISEYGAGLSVLTDSKYGYSCVGGTLRISLLRSSKAPDAHADMGTHSFTYAVMPHKGSWQEAGVVQAAFNLNRPLQIFPAPLGETVSAVGRSFFWLDSTQVILDTVKPAEDVPDGIVVRLYEAFGGKASVTLFSSLAFKSASRCDCLEEKVDGWNLEVKREEDVASVVIEFKPFQLITLMLTL